MHAHPHTITPLSNVVVIEVGTRGCTNRWAHMLRGRFIRLSHQHTGLTCLALVHCVCVCVRVSITPLCRTGEEQICLISYLVTYGSSSIRTHHPQLPHPPTHLHTNKAPSPSETMKVGRTQGSFYPLYVSQHKGGPLPQCF